MDSAPLLISLYLEPWERQQQRPGHQSLGRENAHGSGIEFIGVNFPSNNETPACLARRASQRGKFAFWGGA